VKILGNGELAKRLTLEGVGVSASAREKVAKLGGEVHTDGKPVRAPAVAPVVAPVVAPTGAALSGSAAEGK